MTHRKIIHLDLDAFFCAVEELHDPSLIGKPFAVGGRPDERGVVSSCSYPARRLGIHSAMPMTRAIRICPQLVIIPPHFSDYQEYSQRTMDILSDLTGLIEQVSIDEAFLDITDLPDLPELVALGLQARIREELGLPCSLGVATNKLVAKIANNIGKSSHKGNNPPCSIKVIPPGEEALFLQDLPVKELWGVGPKTEARLNEMGIQKIGQIAKTPESQLIAAFGKWGSVMLRHSQGVDNSPVVTTHAIKSISQEVTFAKDVNDLKVLEQTLRDLSEQVGRQLRRNGLTARTVRIKLRWEDFTTITRQVSIKGGAIDQDNIIYEEARNLLSKAWTKEKKVRLLGVGTSGFNKSVRQLSLWGDEIDKEDRLLIAIDSLHDRFGRKIIQRGRVKEDKTPSPK